MERICKNCESLLYVNKTYCSNCGAKWIEKRITMRNVAADFSDLYLGFDTRFMRTFIDLFKKPEAVINGYIHGRRMGYVDAIRYLLIALFVSGIYVYVLKQANIDINEIAQSFQPEQAVPKDSQITDAAAREAAEKSVAIQKKVNDFTAKLATDYQAIILFATIPFLAIIGRITFFKKRYYNFTEQCVFYMYTYSHSMIVTTPFSIALTLLYPPAMIYISFATFPLMILYNAYAYKRCFQLNLSQIILKTLVALLVVILSFAVLIIAGILIGIAYLIATEK
jgi:hypothetical protein